jgi:DNA-binding response OmpR family regulator
MSHVLVLDDEQAITEIMRRMLEGEKNYRVSTVGSALEALGVLETDQPDFAILDVVMPGVSGIEVARRAAQLDIPVMFMSGEPSTIEALAKADAPLLVKPFHLAELLERTRTLLSENAETLARLRASLRQLDAARARLDLAVETAAHTIAAAKRLLHGPTEGA